MMFGEERDDSAQLELWCLCVTMTVKLFLALI